MASAVVFVVAALCLTFSNESEARDYCAVQCPQGPHIGCNNTGEPSSNCGPKFHKYVFSSEDIQYALIAHNKARSRMALGHVQNGAGETLPQAAAMNTLKWDPELAYLAYLNTLQCEMKHDKCRNTDQQNGQNLASVMMFGYSKQEVQDLLKIAVDGWFNEVKDVFVQTIESFALSTKMIGHYTQLVWDKSTKVGCAAVSSQKGGWAKYFIACNYALGNMIGSPVYEIGTPCSKCPKGCSKKFKGLCA